jgi:D-3-phosphoglycerate dehydrogenase
VRAASRSWDNLLPDTPAFIDCYGVLSDRLTPAMVDLCPGMEVIHGEVRSESELISRIGDRRHVLVYMGYMSAHVMKSCPQLKSIAYLSTGIATHGDLDHAREAGIPFEGVSGYCDHAVAEHTIALAISGLKTLPAMDRAVRSGQWQLTRTKEFRGSVFGIVGLGGIGLETARIAHALGARVIGWNRSRMAPASFVEQLPLDEVLRQSDMLSTSLALNDETQNFITTEHIRKMKPGVVVVNCSRGGIIDQDALLQGLQSGHIGVACLDVFHQEPPRVDDPLLSLANVIATPHSAWYTDQSIDNLMMAGIRLLKDHISRFSHV